MRDGRDQGVCCDGALYDSPWEFGHLFIEFFRHEWGKPRQAVVQGGVVGAGRGDVCPEQSDRVIPVPGGVAQDLAVVVVKVYRNYLRVFGYGVTMV